MTWQGESREEAHLFNPAFLSVLLGCAAYGYSRAADRDMPFPLAFLVSPLVLHQGTREAFPRSTATSLVAWIGAHPELLIGFADRARAFVPHTRQALLFGGMHGALVFSSSGDISSTGMRGVQKLIAESTSEVRDCIRRATFVGKWFAQSGSPETVMVLWGVSP